MAHTALQSATRAYRSKSLSRAARRALQTPLKNSVNSCHLLSDAAAVARPEAQLNASSSFASASRLLPGRLRSSSSVRRASLSIASREWNRSERSEEHTSELQSQSNLVCRLLLEKKKRRRRTPCPPCPSWNSGLPSSNEPRPQSRAPPTTLIGAILPLSAFIGASSPAHRSTVPLS